MKFTILVLLAAFGTAAQAAATLSFEPANPTPADTIVVTIRDTTPNCPVIAPAGIRFASPNEVRLALTHIGDCGFGPFSEAKATLGQLPAGSYTVTVTSDSAAVPPPAAQTLTVSLAAGAGSTNAVAPPENYAGHYLTTQPGEGVFIEQFQDRSFLTFVYYDGSGSPTWVVMPDARWRFNATRSRFEFAGTLYRARRGPESPPSLTVTPIGAGVWYPTGFDTAALETPIDGAASRTMRRFRF